ncbi:MAG TPA: dockerin type I repeat-containing protein, partial [bacterium]|nr:dockerin type I repeat-containing protein [bacterium]
SRLTFWARGKNGGEKVEFFAGGLTGPYPDSFPKVSTGWLTLNSFWTRYSLDLTGKNLSHVIGGFGFTVTGAGNSGGATFYLDDIRYELDRKQQPRFLRSYQPVSPQAPDRFFSSTCFIYDNALALLAFLSRGTPEDLARAGLIADAFLLAQANDRFYQDGRLRNSYRSGDVLDHLTGKARLPGWWDSAQQRWCEDERQVSTDTGNLAWVIIGLVHYYRKNPQMKYLQAAITLGEWIHQHTCSPGGGYTAGYAGWEPQPVKLTYKSTEHNIDLYVAFKLLKEVTGQDLWQERSQHARNFVLSMWNQEGNHFWVGTREDGLTPDTSRKVLDVNTWAVMALKDYYQCVPWLEENFWCQDDIWSGFDFNDDRDGIWFEGTSQMALVYQLTEQPEKFLQVITSLRQVQHHGPNGDGLGIIAASRDGLTTGLSWQYFSRLHLGATCWYLLAERAFNPYWAELIRLRGDLNGDRQIDLVDIIICLRMALGLLEVDLYQADLTQDNLVDILDVITTLTLVLKWN